MRFTPAPRRGAGGLQLTPMIDVVFLLLTYFMASMTLSPPESQLDPALQSERRGPGAASAFQPQVVRVEAGQDGAVFKLGGHVLRTRAALTETLQGLPKDIGVFVRVSDDVDVGAAAAALQACDDAGFRKVTYVPGS